MFMLPIKIPSFYCSISMKVMWKRTCSPCFVQNFTLEISWASSDVLVWIRNLLSYMWCSLSIMPQQRGAWGKQKSAKINFNTDGLKTEPKSHATILASLTKTQQCSELNMLTRMLLPCSPPLDFRLVMCFKDLNLSFNGMVCVCRRSWISFIKLAFPLCLIITSFCPPSPV